MKQVVSKEKLLRTNRCLEDVMEIHDYKDKNRKQIVSAIRKEWMAWPKKFAAIQQAAERVVLENGRAKTFIKCACCQNLVDRSDIQCNHINPVGPLIDTTSEGIAAYRARMFCPVRMLEALCVSCHLNKTFNN